jgi:hypothetical protein
MEPLKRPEPRPLPGFSPLHRSEEYDWIPLRGTIISGIGPTLSSTSLFASTLGKSCRHEVQYAIMFPREIVPD